MKKSTMFQVMHQSLLSEEEVESIIELVGYHDKGCTFTLYTLLQYWAQAAFEQWNGFREGTDPTTLSGLSPANYSTFSKKAKEVPFQPFKQLLDIILLKCNRQTRRQFQLPKELLLIDSTTVTVGKTRLPWAPFHGERAGIKLHVAYRASDGQLWDVVETIASHHDGPIGEQLADMAFIMVQDRVYGKIERIDRYLSEGQSFVIRLKENIHLHNSRSLRRQEIKDSPITRDITCQLGTKQCRSRWRHRVVMFQDVNGREIRVVTDLLHVSVEQIAEIYKARWQVELFFRWIKQHLNVPTLFGTSENAVYGQLYVALIAYVLIRAVYEYGNVAVPNHATLSFAHFSRLLLLGILSDIWFVKLAFLFERSIIFP